MSQVDHEEVQVLNSPPIEQTEVEGVKIQDSRKIPKPGLLPLPRPTETSQSQDKDNPNLQSQPHNFHRPFLQQEHKNSRGRRGSSNSQRQDYRASARPGLLGAFYPHSFSTTHFKHPYSNSYFPIDQSYAAISKMSFCNIHLHWECSCAFANGVYRNPIYPAMMSAKSSDFHSQSQFGFGHSYQTQYGTNDSLQQFNGRSRSRSHISPGKKISLESERRFVAIATDDRQNSFILPPSHPILINHPLTPLLVTPALSSSALEELLKRNQAVSASALSRAMCDVSNGDFSGSIDTVETAISLISKSAVAHDERCKVLIESLEDTVKVIHKQKSLASRSTLCQGQGHNARNEEIVRQDRQSKVNVPKRECEHKRNERERSEHRCRNRKKRSRSWSWSRCKSRSRETPTPKRHDRVRVRDQERMDISMSRSDNFRNRESESRRRVDRNLEGRKNSGCNKSRRDSERDDWNRHEERRRGRRRD